MVDLTGSTEAQRQTIRNQMVLTNEYRLTEAQKDALLVAALDAIGKLQEEILVVSQNDQRDVLVEAMIATINAHLYDRSYVDYDVATG